MATVNLQQTDANVTGEGTHDGTTLFDCLSRTQWPRSHHFVATALSSLSNITVFLPCPINVTMLPRRRIVPDCGTPSHANQIAVCVYWP